MSRREALPPAVTSADDLIAAGLAAPEDQALMQRLGEEFRIRISPEMLGAMAGPAAAGVTAQFLPDARELDHRPEQMPDPIGDDVHRVGRGLTHRYPDRVILHATQTCEVYCRFCFRREKVGEEGLLPEADLAEALAYLHATPAVREVILTGGDPLTLSPRRLAALMGRLSDIPHLDVIRLHSRIPVVAPERITADLIAALDQRPAVWLVVHTNHPAELTAAACAALRRLTAAGVPLLSQSVLLKGVNADAETLEALFRALIRNRVKPYYLHHCDLAPGTHHFRTSIAEGQAIMAALRGRLSGTALPTYVLDIPGGHGKVPVGPGYLEADGDRWTVTDPNGQRHAYRDP